MTFSSIYPGMLLVMTIVGILSVTQRHFMKKMDRLKTEGLLCGCLRPKVVFAVVCDQRVSGSILHLMVGTTWVSGITSCISFKN